jgi:hypothetical protein
MKIPSRDRRDPGRSNPVLRHIKPAGPAGAETFVAVVHAPDGIRLAAMADSRAELVRRLAEYVRRRATHVLHAEHARHVRALLARGELEVAVEAYFRLVGGRWEEEWLVTAALARDARCDVGAALDAVAATPGSALRSREA